MRLAEDPRVQIGCRDQCSNPVALDDRRPARQRGGPLAMAHADSQIGVEPFGLVDQPRHAIVS